MVKNKHGGTVSQFRLCNEAQQIDEIDLIEPNRVLVMGRVTSGSPPVVTILALPSGAVVDHFGCYLPALSPDHHYLAFLKNFPPHPGPVNISQEYIVYDLTRDAEYNRPHFKAGVEYDAGWPVYPPGATNAVQENLVADLTSPVHACTSSYLFWLDDRSVGFSDYFEDSNRVVFVDLADGLRNARLQTTDLGPDLVDLDHCEKAASPSDFAAWSQHPAGLIHINQMDLAQGPIGAVCLYFAPNPCVARSHLIVNFR